MRLILTIAFLALLSPYGEISGQQRPSGRTGVLLPGENGIHANRADFEYEIELLPGQEFSGYIYHWSDWGTAWGELHEEPQVNWLSVSPTSFHVNGCERPLPVKFTFKAPNEPGTYKTTVEDWEYSWPDNVITLIVTETPNYKMTDSIIILDGPGITHYRYQEHEYHGINPNDSWYEQGYCGDDPYLVDPQRRIVHTLFPPNPNINIEPSDFILSLDEEMLVTKSFRITENKVDSFYESVTLQWRSYPEYTKWKVIPASAYCKDWDQIPSLRIPSVKSEAIVLNDMIYVIGGKDPVSGISLGRIEKYEGDRWDDDPDELIHPRYDFSCAVQDNRIYVFGGKIDDSTALNSIEYFDGNTWTVAMDTLPVPIYHHSGMVYANNYYLFGGRTGTVEGIEYDRSLRRYLPQNGITVLSDTLPFSPREGHRCVKLGRYIYVIGGMVCSFATDTAWYDDVFRYDPVLNAFEQVESMKYPRSDFACGAMDGLLYVAGGKSSNHEAAGSLEYYNPDTEKWYQCDDMPDLSFYSSAFTTLDNELYLLGGSITRSGFRRDYRTCFGTGFFTGSIEEPREEPEPELLAFPNPLRDDAVVTFVLPYDSKVTFRLFDLRGRLIETIVDDDLLAGKYQFFINGRLLAEGLYLGELQMEKHRLVTKLVKVKH